jgi:hypothetical protein
VRDRWASVLLWLVEEEPKQKADPFGMTTKEARTTAKADEFYFAFEQGIV